MEFVYKQSPGYLVNVLSRLYNQSLAARLSAHKATPAQLPVLLSLWQNDGQTQSELCRRMRIEQPTLANTLNRMVRDRLVRKVADTNDRRQVRIRLTQRARDLKPILTKSAMEVHDTAMRGMTESGLETLLMMLNKIISNLDEDLNESPLMLDEALLDPVSTPPGTVSPGAEAKAIEEPDTAQEEDPGEALLLRSEDAID